MKCSICVMTLAVLLAGCGESKQAPPPKLFEPQRQALDKAKGVEQTVNQQAEQQQQEADRQAQ